MDIDKILPLLFLLFIALNYVFSQYQKAKAEEKRRRRLAQKGREKPPLPARPVSTARPQQPRPVREKPAPSVQRVPRPTPPRRAPADRWEVLREAKPARKPIRTRDIIREWAERLEKALEPTEVFPPEPTPKPIEAVRPKPAPPEKYGPTRVEMAPVQASTAPPALVVPRPSSVEFLGRLHPNPLVNGIILSEILSLPLALRRDQSVPPL